MVKLDPSLWRRAQVVFDHLVDLARDARAPALAIACGEDDELREMVQGLLEADDSALPEPQPAVIALGKLLDPELLPGSRIGRFRIEKLIGAGGMGRVYLAHRSDGLVDQRVAVKTIRGACSGRDLLDRFARERRILAKLDHPHVARFIDAGECPDGSPFVAMEFVSGTPILEYAHHQKLTLSQRLRMFLKVASAVDYAHRQLVVHRDLKPGNVMVDAKGEPKLLDFGIAKPLQEHQEQSHLEGRTAPDARYFSLRHAAPEQIDGEADSVSVDIYALGGLLYELLTGRMPLEFDGLSFNQARARIQGQMPPPPSSVVGGDLPYAGRELAGDLDRILLHALRKEPQLRYASAAALIDDLTHLLEHRPISLRASHRWYLIARFLRRHRVASALLAGLLSVIIGAASVYRYQRDEALRESTRAEMVSSILTEAFRSADPSRNGGERLTARDVMRQARLAVGRHHELDPSTRGQLLLTLSDVHSSLGQNDEARQLAQQALDLAGNSPEDLAAQVRLAETEFDAGQTAAAKKRVLALLETPELAPRTLVRLRLLHLDLESQLNQLDVTALAAEIHEQARQLLAADDSLVYAAALAHASRLVNDPNTATKGIALIRTQLGKADQNQASPEHWNLLRLAARAERNLGDVQAALTYASRSLAMAEKLYGTEHPTYVIAQTGYAISLSAAGRKAQARKLYDDIFERAERVYGRESVMVALLANNMGSLAMEAPIDLPKALQMTAMAVEIGPRVMPADSRQMAYFWCGRASALLLRAGGDAMAALTAAETAIAIAVVTLEASRPLHAEAELLAAIAEVRLGQEQEARRRIARLGTAIDQISSNAPALTLARELSLTGAIP